MDVDAPTFKKQFICHQWLTVVIQKIVKVWNQLVNYMFNYQDGTCLAALRMIFGFLMLIDTVDERGFCRVEKRWMESAKCYFPLVDFIQPLPGEWMCLVYATMFTGILGILIGFHYRTSCVIYAILYWYILLADKSAWNNHSYLFGLLILLFSVIDAHNTWSVDKMLGKIPEKTSNVVPQWNYMLLKIQFFILYFVAGLKKLEPDWLSGYSMMSLGYHTVFRPFRYFFPAKFVDHWIVHVSGFLIDLLSGFGLIFQSTRKITLIVLIAFHSMNSMMFSIGMFPYMCTAMLPVFCNTDWLSQKLSSLVNYKPYNKPTPQLPSPLKQNLIVAGICIYTTLQMFLPYSHFITQGYNGWRNGLYGYSWDMMVYNIDVAKIQIKVVDHSHHEQFYLDPHAWTENSKWILHGDMIRQFAQCAAANMPDRTNITIHMDIWASLNGRFHQRLIDPQIDILKAPWSPWSKVVWLMPIMRHLDKWRPLIVDAKNQAQLDLMFLADFPGMKVHNYFDNDTEIILSILEGVVTVDDGEGPVQLISGDAASVNGEHAITTMSTMPSCYIYIINNTISSANENQKITINDQKNIDLQSRCSTVCYSFIYRLITNLAKIMFLM
ncbi:vitamin K-dependent gamma-carboxylase [Daktulosphaira vitifoliae]|uniref:vitamin K-dependent gamma-carboxylase n=1 Tax=Daktulosphaira vitifoliae TaxID=58002 RepID=UPI0021AACAA5|nr:vitamin K-dependent gamma-carboxylase [Daktulosphaira vitifoliae]